ncbi:MAG: AAA family ATPase, partial [Synergistaceae bacterium]
MSKLPTNWDRELNSNSASPEEQLQNFISSCGVNPKSLPAVKMNGKIHRFAVEGDKGNEKAGWYIAWCDDAMVGVVGSWSGGGFERTWYGNIGRELTAEEIIEYKERLRVAKEIHEVEKQKHYEQIANAVSKILQEVLPATSDHPYLERKQVKSYNIYRTGDNRLMMPILLDGRLASAQYISEDGSKQFHGGGEIKGGYFNIGPLPPNPGSAVYLAEGYATAASIYEQTQCTTVIALNAGNLLNVAKWLRERLGATQEIIVVGDNDASGTGQRAANECGTVTGARVIIPPVIGDANDYINNGGDLKALLQGTSNWLTQADDFCSKPSPIRWLVKKWIQCKGLSMVFGDSGTGKTFVVLDWVLRIASENIESWAGQRIKHGGVVYLAGEGHQGLKARIAGFKKYFGVEKLNAWVSASECELNTQDGLAKTISEIRSINCDNISVIIVDTLHRFLVGDENKAVDAKTMLDACSILSRTFDCSVVLVHHTGANQEARGRARGSTAWRGALDNQVLVENMGDRIKISQVKNKDGEITAPVYMERVPVHLPGWYDEDGESISTIVLVPDEKGEEKEINPLTKSQQFGLQTYREAVEQYGEVTEDDELLLDIEDWRKVFYEKCGSEKIGTMRQKFNRAKEELLSLGELICIQEKISLSEDYELEKTQI